MLNAILADDEPIIIKGLKKLIPWEELGIAIVGEAMTGRGLMEQIELTQPDLVITDISMPDGSGIDVIKEVQRLQLRTKIIFISAYQEFSYAKDALAFGAVDYLVKPIEKRLLLEAVGKAMTLLQEANEDQSSKGKLAVYEQKDKKTQLEELFDRLTQGDIRWEEAQRKLQALNTQFTGPCFSVLYVKLAHVQLQDGRWGEHEKRLLVFAVSNLVDELIQLYGSGLVFRKGENLCVIVNHMHVEDDLQPLVSEMRDKILFYLKIHVTICIGMPAHSLQDIRQSYLSAVETMNYSYFEKDGTILSWSQNERRGGSDQLLADAKQAVIKAVIAKEKQQVQELLGSFFEHAAAGANGRKESAILIVYALLTDLMEEMSAVGIDPQVSSEQRKDWQQRMHQFYCFGDLIAFINARILDILEQVSTAGGSREAQQMKMIKEYIEEHYSENITLESMASQVFMNPYYFSSFFKKHTNENFKQYVTNIRMKNAVRLLLQTDLLVYEIAEQVGYHNPRQFSDMFKKSYGKLPHEYKSQIKG
ncbi:response regulator [Paenibacillus sp. CGMCC 1.16610]|uniref:Response regulator n=1 Tax=Paenibacillus anseongense TaxID=2682845 RepID=A0ABW9U4G0_9BACL|nr:response regulator [Paenibacillus sp. CGMCC 1.16610]MBA2938946.1 response regulator [Paenibacillus sp. CGMCC 1.16610]MVQ34908.1 response regulator [Paenibacillus anseongense]